MKITWRVDGERHEYKDPNFVRDEGEADTIDEVLEAVRKSAEELVAEYKVIYKIKIGENFRFA